VEPAVEESAEVEPELEEDSTVEACH
jgi:hypothetical protein